MATRSGGGTGVIVALVVFIITTVFLLVMTIVFYSNYSKALVEQRNAQTALDKYASREQRNREELKRIEASLGPGQSVYGYLSNQLADMSRLVAGADVLTVADARTQLRLGETDSVRQHLGAVRSDLSAKQAEVDSLNAAIASKDGEIQSLRTQMEELAKAHAREIEGVRGVIATAEQASKDYDTQLRETISAVEKAKDELESDYREKENELRRTIDSYSQENTVLKTRVAQLQKAVEAIRIKPKNPAELVDGRVIDVAGNDQLFIDIGEINRVVLGMTFEIYDDASAIRPDETTGDYPRGKASVQVIKVAETTATCKITRSVPGRPVVKSDVVANAVYDPDYKFKFLVHGLFDVDSDGRSTTTEAEYLRAQIIQWGGAVVEGDNLVGDLDFLVMGQQPREPAPLSPNATEAETDAYLKKREAFELYNSLFNQARQAQIPVLNWNRLQVLIGHVNR
jgi:hypothetical protein